MANGRVDPARFETVRLADLRTDPEFNRPVSSQWVARLVADFQLSRIGRLAVSRRADGTLVLIDGQHRVAALSQMGVPEGTKCIPADVYEGLSRAEEALLFVHLNNTKHVNSLDKYIALRRAKDPETCAIDQILAAHDLRAAYAKTDGTLGCIDALRRVFNMGEPKGAVLGRTLATIGLSWGPIREAYAASIVRGIGLYLNAHRDIEPKTLADALLHRAGAPLNLLGWAKGIAGIQRMPVDRAIALVIEQRVVNRRHRPRKAS